MSYKHTVGYSFSAILDIEYFRSEQKKNLFRLRNFTLPDFKIYEEKEVKFKGVPTNQILRNFSYSPLKCDVYLTDEYDEYKLVFNWLKELQQNRERLHTSGLLTDMTLYILDSKEEKIHTGIKFRSAYPLSINEFTYERKVTSPLVIPMTFKFLDQELVDQEIIDEFDRKYT
jgi:hypothetical protein